jgi:hypothetical protein
MGTKQRHHILFDEEKHTYTNTNTGELSLSCTSFIAQFHEKFDADAIAFNLVTNVPKYREKYQGMEIKDAIADIKMDWRRRTEVGNTVHKILENHFLGINVFDSSKGEKWNRRIKMLTSAYDRLCLEDRNQGFEFFSEMILYSDRHKLAGQSDKVLINHQSRTFKVLDYKTNRKGIERSAYQDKRMYPPVGHLPDCNYSHYSLQLTLYAYFLEQELNYQCAGLTLLWVNTNNPESVAIIEIPVTPLINEIEWLLDRRSQQLI